MAQDRERMLVREVWRMMIRRCHNPADLHFPAYGAIGVRVCPRWHDLNAFLLDMGPRPPGMTVSRIDHEQGYGPENCRWETYGQQNRATSRNRLVEWQGETLALVVWAERLNLCPRSLSQRLQRGWAPERAFTTPTRRSFAESQSLSQAQRAAVWVRKGKEYSRRQDAKRRQRLEALRAA